MDLFGSDPIYVIVSDHGSVGFETVIDPFRVLERAGLLVYQGSDGSTPRVVDWTRTSAYPIGSCHVYVNLEGRDPQGIVPAGSYERVAQQVIHALQEGFWDEGRQRSALAFALPNAQAGLVGLGGPLCGDVVYGIAGGSIGGHVGGIHACQIPTAATATGDIRSTLLISGPGFGTGRDIETPTYLWDVAPTLCYVLGYPRLENGNGKIVAEALQ